MTRRRPDPLPTPQQIEAQVRAAVRALEGIPRWYADAYRRGLDPRMGSEVHVAAGVSDYVPSAAVDSITARLLRDGCRRIAEDVAEAERRAGNARDWLRRHIEPGYRQPPRDRARAVVDDTEWQAALERQRRRAERGEE